MMQILVIGLYGSQNVVIPTGAQRSGGTLRFLESLRA